MEVKIKITPAGGYVMGEGDCPFDPDTFVKLFGHKVLEAQRKGLQDAMLDAEQVDQIIADRKGQWDMMIDAAPVKTIEYEKGSVDKLLESADYD